MHDTTFVPHRQDNLFFEHRRPRVRLPIAEAQRLFQDQHDPCTRQVLARLGSGLKQATLLDRHLIGTSFNFVRDNQILQGDKETDPAACFCRHFGLPQGARTGLYLAGALAEGVARVWIEEGPKALGLETAAKIGRGDPMLAGWVRRLLYQRGPELSWLRRPPAMIQVVDKLREQLGYWHKAGRQPSPDEVLGWIDLIGRGQPLPLPGWPPVDERKIPREAEGPPGGAEAAPSGLIQRMELLERQQAQMFSKLSGIASDIAAPG